MDYRLEVIVVPVSDVDRAKAFYSDRAGFQVDHDTQISDAVRVVQLTPRGSGCSIVVGTGVTEMQPGSLDGLRLVVGDMDAAHAELTGQGLDISDVEVLGRPGRPGFKHADFADPDGNRWTLQEIPGAG